MLLRSRPWPWFAVLVRTCREKTARSFLEGAGYECYVPVAKTRHRWSDRMKEFEEPLFPGYLFCRMNPLNRLPVLKSPGVIQIVGAGKTPIPVEEEEIAAIQQVEKSGLAAIPWPYLQIGSTAMIDDGPLCGLSGIVVKIKSGLKLLLSVSLLQRSVAVEVNREWLRPIQPVSSRHDRHTRMDQRSINGAKDAGEKSAATSVNLSSSCVVHGDVHEESW